MGHLQHKMDRKMGTGTAGADVVFLDVGVNLIVVVVGFDGLLVGDADGGCVG